MAKYWFRQKSFGIGSAPNTWQGWTVTVVGVVLIFAIVFQAKQIADRQTSILVALSGVAIVSAAMSLIAWIKTEGGWVWRGSPKANETVRGTVSSEERRERESARAAGELRNGRDD